MNLRNVIGSIAALFAVVLILSSAAHAQETLGTAKELYASAAYREALIALDKLKRAPPGSGETLEIEKYRAYCLLALGRTADADESIAAIVAADPLARQDESSASPRVVAAFRAVRRRLLPSIAQQSYATAKGSFDRKEYSRAAEQFGRLLAILDDPDWPAGGSLGLDLRTVAAAFLDLSHAAERLAAEAKPPTAPVRATSGSNQSPPSPTSRPAGDPPFDKLRANRNETTASASGSSISGKAAQMPLSGAEVYEATDRDVTPPVAVRQVFPVWPPVLARPLAQIGSLEVVIDEQGRVESAAIRQSISPVYDGLVLTAVKQWRYRPAERQGRAVKFRKRFEISYSPTAR